MSLREEIDHGRMAPPCRTVTCARRSDKRGKVKVEEANKIVARMALMVLKLVGIKGQDVGHRKPMGFVSLPVEVHGKIVQASWCRVDISAPMSVWRSDHEGNRHIDECQLDEGVCAVS